ncbi:MAG TPA: primosomal protein N' [Dehalococcoidia bacterium]|nr:primosomal protein N' [Dehalococcoidia bacterium]
MPYAEVAVNAPFPSRQSFTYRIPDGLDVRPGHLLYVPFGQRVVQGVALEVTDAPAYAEARDVLGLASPEPLLLPHQPALARWLCDYYMAPLFDCVALMLPPGSEQRPLTYVRPCSAAPEATPLRLPPAARRVLEMALARGQVEMRELERTLGPSRAHSAVAALVRRGLVERSYALAPPRGRHRTATRLRLLLPPPQAEALAEEWSRRRPRLASLLRALAREGPLMDWSEARARMRLTRAALAPALARGAVALEEAPFLAEPPPPAAHGAGPPPVLTPPQAEAAEAIVAALRSPRPGDRPAAFLLHGLTGSGKTEVYLAAIAETLARGKRAIVLVPEISLTPQTLQRFSARFPGQVAVLHSGLSLREQLDTWYLLREGRYGVVVGARSAIFAPLPDLGLVVIDEEHEWTYKEEERAPRYHARRVAEELCRLTGAVLVLGSATPDVESYHAARSGRYRLLELPHRLRSDGRGGVVPSPLPEVTVVDMRRELREGHRGIFSRLLLQEMAAALDAGEQVVLFLNRRGTASFLQCQECGHVPTCPGCEVAYTFHGDQGRLVCHHCNRGRRVPDACPACGGTLLRPMGAGTQRVEEEVRRLFPGVRTLRWDRDAAHDRRAHERIMSLFASHQADVLVGTQMLAKGLDLPLVTVVGVVLADIGLHVPDFRAGERTFQLLEQVAGRAGRGPRGGRVVLQTYSPTHPVVQAVASHDYLSLYREEVALRARLRYPPFGRLVRLTCSHPNGSRAREEAARQAARLRDMVQRQGLDVDVLGPAPAYPLRLRGRYRWHVTLRGPDPHALLRLWSPPEGWTVDVDPLGTP